MSLQALLKSKGVVAGTTPTTTTTTTELQDLFQTQPKTTAIAMPASLHHHKFNEPASRPVLIERAAKGAVAQIHTVKTSTGNAYTIARPVLKQTSALSFYAAPVFYGTDRLALRSEGDAPPAFAEVQVQALPIVKVNPYKGRLYFNAAPLPSFTPAAAASPDEAAGVSRAMQLLAVHTGLLFKFGKRVKLLSTEARHLGAPPGPVETMGGGVQDTLVSAKVSTQVSQSMSRVAVLIHADKMVGAPPEAPVVGVRFDDATSTTMRTGLTLTHKGAAVPVSMWATDFHAAYGEGDPAVRALQLQATPAVFYLKGTTGRDGDQWEVEQVTPLYAHRADVQAHTMLQSDVLCNRILEALKVDLAADDGKNKEGTASELAARIEYVRTVGALPLQMLANGFVQDKMAVGLCAEVLKGAAMPVNQELLEALVAYDAECTRAAPRIPEEPADVADLFKALFETAEGRTVCALATFALPSAREDHGTVDASDDDEVVVSDDDEDEDDDEEEVVDEVVDEDKADSDDGGGDSSTADAKESPPGKRVAQEEEEEVSRKAKRPKHKAAA